MRGAAARRVSFAALAILLQHAESLSLFPRKEGHFQLKQALEFEKNTFAPISSQSEPSGRRSVLRSSAAVVLSIMSGNLMNEASFAEERTSSKPFAPTEALVPAARVKRIIDRSIEITEGLASGGASNSQLKELEDLLIIQTNQVTRGFKLPEVPKQPASQYLKSYQNSREQLSLLEKPGAILAQNGEVRAWKILKEREKKMEMSNDVRAALNLYTYSLSFSGDRYQWNGSKEEKSQRIRDENLPNILTQVIASDMGVRYLYRNDLLTALDDAKAELIFQMKDPAKFETSELLFSLKEAQTACNKWFDLIDERDVEEAMALVKNS